MTEITHNTSFISKAVFTILSTVSLAAITFGIISTSNLNVEALRTPISYFNVVSDWRPDGATPERPLIAYGRGAFVQTVRGTDNGIYTRASEDGLNWTPWTPSGSTFYTPHLQFTDRFWQSVRGTDNKAYSRFSYDGFNWTQWQYDGIEVGAATTYAWQDELTLFQSAVGLDGSIRWRKSFNSGSNWGLWGSIPGAASGTPAFQFTPETYYDTETWYIVVRGTDNNIYITATSNQAVSFSPWRLTGTTFQNPIAHANGFYVIGTDSAIYYIDGITDAPNVDDLNWQPLIVQSQGVPLISRFFPAPSYQGTMTFSDFDGNITLRATTGSNALINDLYQPGFTAGVTSSQIGAASDGETLVETVRGSDSQIYTRTIQIVN